MILDAGYIRDGLGSSDIWTIAGNISVTSNGGGFAAQCRFNVDSVISGSGKLYIADNGSGEAARTIYIDSGLNTYNGSIQMLSRSDATHSRLTFTANSLMNFTIGANGVNNSISGIGTAEFDGDFNIDLTGGKHQLSAIAGCLRTQRSQTYDATFTVNGFTSLGEVIMEELPTATLTSLAKARGL